MKKLFILIAISSGLLLTSFVQAVEWCKDGEIKQIKNGVMSGGLISTYFGAATIPTSVYRPHHYMAQIAVQNYAKTFVFPYTWKPGWLWIPGEGQVISKIYGPTSYFDPLYSIEDGVEFILDQCFRKFQDGQPFPEPSPVATDPVLSWSTNYYDPVPDQLEQQ